MVIAAYLVIAVFATATFASSEDLSLESIEKRLMRASEESNAIFNATHVALLRAKQRLVGGSHSFSKSGSASGSGSDESDQKSRSRSASDESYSSWLRRRSWSRSDSGSSESRMRPGGMPKKYRYWNGALPMTTVVPSTSLSGGIVNEAVQHLQEEIVGQSMLPQSDDLNVGRQDEGPAAEPSDVNDMPVMEVQGGYGNLATQQPTFSYTVE